MAATRAQFMHSFRRPCTGCQLAPPAVTTAEFMFTNSGLCQKPTCRLWCIAQHPNLRYSISLFCALCHVCLSVLSNCICTLQYSFETNAVDAVSASYSSQPLYQRRTCREACYELCRVRRSRQGVKNFRGPLQCRRQRQVQLSQQIFCYCKGFKVLCSS
jgi:hypothetical protein